MDRSMRVLIDDLQILDPVVCANAVEMMNMLFLGQPPSQKSLKDIPMFLNTTTIDPSY